MKQLICIATCMLLLGTDGWAQTPSEQARVVDSFHAAAANADIDSYLALLTEDMVFLGTDGSERWQGEAFRQFARENFNAGRGWLYTPQQRVISVSADGSTAWFDELLNNEMLGQCRGSGVLVNTSDGWKIAQYNLSVPVPNELVLQVVADIAAMDGKTAPSTPVHVEPDDAGPAPAEPAAEPDAEPARTANCSRNRHKTNRKAGC